MGRPEATRFARGGRQCFPSLLEGALLTLRRPPEGQSLAPALWLSPHRRCQVLSALLRRSFSIRVFLGVGPIRSVRSDLDMAGLPVGSGTRSSRLPEPRAFSSRRRFSFFDFAFSRFRFSQRRAMFRVQYESGRVGRDGRRAWDGPPPYRMDRPYPLYFLIPLRKLCRS